MRAVVAVAVLALCAGCGSDEERSGKKQPPPAPVTVLDARLDLEVSEAIHVVVVRIGDDVSVSVRVTDGFGVAPADTPLAGVGRIDEYPEAGARLYTGRIDGPAVAGGPCGDEPVSLALSLHADARGDTPFVAGALTAYCGKDRWHGVPPIEPLRVSGRVR